VTSIDIKIADCVEAMQAMDEASVDAIVTDPPYGLEFMGKEWDRLDRIGFHQGEPQMFAEGGSVSLPATPKLSQGKGKRCDDCGKYAGGNPKINCTCDEPRFRNVSRGAEQEAWHLHWVTEAFRVLKPGGHLLAFGGTRTYHRLACAIEDAGFEIRDSLIWLYGSGFPKSHNISKAVDKTLGAEREVVGTRVAPGMAKSNVDQGAQERSTLEFAQTSDEAVTPEAEQWQGWGTALKPAHEPIVVARKPLIGTVAQNCLEHGTGAINVDGCRVGADGGGWNGLGDTHDEEQWRLNNPDGVQRQSGRWPANVALSHLPECERVGTRRVKGTGERSGGDLSNRETALEGGDRIRTDHAGHADPDGTEQVEAWRCAEGCPVAELDRQSGESTAPRRGATLRTTGRQAGVMAGAKGMHTPGREFEASDTYAYGDTGGASRFFYVAKASRAERNAGLDGFEEQHGDFGGMGKPGAGFNEVVHGKAPQHRNNHPTVKPIDLMRWLVRLVTPPGGTCLDCFAGSGTTGVACSLEGFDFIGIEREAEYAEIARARIEHWQKVPQGTETKAALKAEAKERKRKAKEVQDGLF
jgi:DNA modification methylase